MRIASAVLLIVLALIGTACRSTDSISTVAPETTASIAIEPTPEIVAEVLAEIVAEPTSGETAALITPAPQEPVASTSLELPTPDRIEGGTPVVVGVGRPIGVTPDGSAVIATGAHPGGFLSCENSPAEAFWLVPLDGSPRSLLSDHEIHSGGVDSFSIHDDQAVWMQYCDGYPIGPFVASINDGGAFGTIRLIELPYEADGELGNPRWLDDGTLEIALASAGIATMLVVDPATATVARSREVPVNEAFPTPMDWEFETATGRWIVPLSNDAALAVPGLGSDLTFFRPAVEHPTRPLVLLTMPSDTPAWFQIVAVPLTDAIEIAASVPSATALVGGWGTANEVLLALRDGESWLMQRIDPVDPCSAELFIRSLNGVDQPVGSNRFLRPLSTPLADGDNLLFTTGCPSRAHDLVWASLDVAASPHLTIESQAKVPLGTQPFFRSIEVLDDRIIASYGDPRRDTSVVLDRDGVLGTTSLTDEGYGPRLRDPFCEISTLFPPGWTANIAGGGAGGFELRHPSGANILAFCRGEDVLGQFNVDPRTNPASTPAEPVLVTSYDPANWYGASEKLEATRWQLVTATDAQPGRSQVLQVRVQDRWIHVLANAPGDAARDPDLVGTINYVLDEVRVGITGG